ncbi:MAG: PRD domain-containing protein [Actinobacteria bacterium]|nr:PRD domain-containing protein [Actinomycetota bacterium]MCG2799050.1 PRD domain-containing protein [Cellulomonas sp.]
MKVRKVFNNNVVLAVDHHDAEHVLLGRGLGFQVTPGTPVDESLVEKRFVVSDQAHTPEKLAAFVAEIPLADIEVTEEILRTARERLGAHVADHVLVPLADHVSFALRRVREGAPAIEYPLRWEVKHLYPAEVAFGREALEIIARRTGVVLPDVEAVPLALHFVNAQFGTDLDSTVRMTEVLGEILGLIQATFAVDIDAESVAVARFVTHLRYLFLRERHGGLLSGMADDLPDTVRTARPREFACAEKVAALLGERYGWTLTGEELLYLALHVYRLTAPGPVSA